MSTYSIHGPISSRRPGTSSVALRTSTAVVIMTCVLAALVAVAFVVATQTTSVSVKHLGRAASISATGDRAATDSVVASNGAAPAATAKAVTPVRPWRETLHGRALILSWSAAPALAGPVGTGQ